MKPIQRIFITRNGGQLWQIPVSTWDKHKANYVREGYRAATMNEIQKAGVILKEVTNAALDAINTEAQQEEE
jgi:hypothetical protein